MSGAKCSAPGCTKTQRSRTTPYCDMHRTRLRRHGSLENPAPSWPNAGRACELDGCDEPARVRSMCEFHYRRSLASLPLDVPRPPRDHEERFWSHVNKSECCWTWRLTLTYDGYGIFGVDGERTGAHRWALRLDGVDIPEGMHVDHLCRNRACVRPDHLEVVTPQENTRRRGLPAPCLCHEEVQP